MKNELDNYVFKGQKRAVNFRFNEKSIKRLKEISESHDIAQSEILELLITALYQTFNDWDIAPYSNKEYFEKLVDIFCNRFRVVSSGEEEEEDDDDDVQL